MKSFDDINKEWQKISGLFSKISPAKSRGKKTKQNPQTIQADIINNTISNSSNDLKVIETFIEPVQEKLIQENQQIVDSIDKTKEKEQETPQTETTDWDFLKESITESLDTNAIADLTEEIIQDNIDINILPLITEELQDLLYDIDILIDKISDDYEASEINNLHRKVHTLKGTVGQAGAMRARNVMHQIETVMEDIVENDSQPIDKKSELINLFSEAKGLIKPLIDGSWVNNSYVDTSKNSDTEVLNVNVNKEESTPLKKPIVNTPKTVRVKASDIDKMISAANEIRLSGTVNEEFITLFKNKLKDLEDNSQRAFKTLRDIELQAEIQIQSRRSQLQELGEDFDPLEMDRFTRLQELSRSMGECISDILEIKKDMAKGVSQQEANIFQQKQHIQSTRENLHNARLTPVDAINDRLYNTVWTAAKEVNKDIDFEMNGTRLELDRVLLEKIIAPLEHILRNSVVHGIEDKEERIRLGKPEKGLISVSFSQEAGKTLIEISDDGYGLRIEKIKQKAVDKGLWSEDKEMTIKDAAEMICKSSFSTAENVTQIAGRGIGMDVVRSDVLSMGGVFEINSLPKNGLTISIQLPTSTASVSVLVVENDGEKWAFPIEMVEHVTLLSANDLISARISEKFPKLNGFDSWDGVKFINLSSVVGSTPTTKRPERAHVLLLKERNSFMALEVSRLVQVFEAPLRHPGIVWSKIPSIAGTVILPSSEAVFLIDPFNYEPNETIKNPLKTIKKSTPTVMVVDDSLTVRKATTRFLSKNGFDSITAKDGQDALEVLANNNPAIILMDIEMPKMDGFDCVRNIKNNPKIKDIPIIMITSRTSLKHRSMAEKLGVNEYLGKPFKEPELLELLNKYTRNK